MKLYAKIIVIHLVQKLSLCLVCAVWTNQGILFVEMSQTMPAGTTRSTTPSPRPQIKLYQSCWQQVCFTKLRAAPCCRIVLTVNIGANGNGDGLTGAYYNNRWLQDSPVLTRIDKYIDFEWGTDLVTPSAKDYVSVRWTGYIKPQYQETYTFYVDVDVSMVFRHDAHIIERSSFLSTWSNSGWCPPLR